MRKIEYFGYIQDEWKIEPNLAANIGLRYEFFNAFSEIHNRDIPFDVQGCGGYCPVGSPFAYPPTLNLAPRLSLAWAPDRFGGRTVIRVGGGIFYGDAQLGDQYSPANNDAVRYTNSDYDVRHGFSANFAYQIPFGANRWYGGWEWSGTSTARTGLPINITVTRPASTLPDGNALSPQRPNLVSGVPLYLNYATTGLWLNPAAFATPAPGTWGDLGRDVLRAPGLFQIDTAVSKRVHFTERVGGQLGFEFFNVLNHPQLGAPSANITSTSNFGRILAPINTSPVWAGTPSQIQAFARLSF